VPPYTVWLTLPVWWVTLYASRPLPAAYANLSDNRVFGL